MTVIEAPLRPPDWADTFVFNLMNLKMNITNDPVLAQPEFVRLLSRIRGD